MAELPPGPGPLLFWAPSDQKARRVADQRAQGQLGREGVLQRVWSGPGEEDTGLTATRFKFSTCLTITLHPAFPSFFPLVFCALM